jgi:glycosidase
MKHSRQSRVFVLTVIIFVSLLTALHAQSPQVNKIEPPNWWVGMPHNPMLLLTGDNLHQAAVSVQYKGVSITRTQSSADGHYLFLWLRIARETQPGNARISVRTPAGTARVALPLKKRSKVAETGKGIHTDDVLYLIMPDRFADADTDASKSHNHVDRAEPKAYHGGDLNGVTDHLGYLKELGITAIWLTPWWKNDGSSADYHGYHVTDFYAVDDHLGSMDDLRQMVATAHKMGIKVVSDYVANHTGPEDVWAQRPPTPTWLHGTPEHHLEPKYNFWPLVDVHATLRDRRPVIEGWFAGKLPDLNPDDPLLCEYLADNAIWWMESAHFDGYRLDTFPYSTREFWGKWHRTLREVYPQVTSVGEVFDDSPVVTSFFEGGHKILGTDSGATTVFDFPLYERLRGVLSHGEPVTKLVNVLEQDYLYLHPEGLYTFIGNHDQKRLMSDDGATLEKLKAAFSLLLTLRGIPQIYYGDEIAMRGGEDPDNRRDFPGGFSGDKHNAFSAAGRSNEEQQMFTHVQQLTRLHKEHPALQSGEMVLLESGESFFAYMRARGSDRMLIVFNASPKEQTIEIMRGDTPLEKITSAVAVVDAKPVIVGAEKLSVPVAPMSVAIYSLK